MTKQEIYNTLKTKQLHHAIRASKLAIECENENLTGDDLKSTIDFAKKQHIKSTTLLIAIDDLLGEFYKGHKVMNAENELLLDQWNELEKKRLGL